MAYRHLEVKVTSEEGLVAKKRKKKLSSFDIYREANRRMQSPRSSVFPFSQAMLDEYECWQSDMKATDGGITGSHQYWITRAKDYLRLSRMALDVMTVPAMSAEVERLFSAVGLMVTPLSS
jgi:hypothetical protein